MSIHSMQQCTTGHWTIHTQYIQYNNVLLVTLNYTHNTFNTTMYYWSHWTTHTIHSIQQCTTGHWTIHTHNTFNTTMYYWSLNYTHTIHSIQQCTTGHTELYTHNTFNTTMYYWSLNYTQYIQYNNVLLVTELYTHNAFSTTMYYWSLNYTHTMHSIQQCTTGHSELYTHNAFNKTMYYWSLNYTHNTFNTTMYYWSLNYTHTMHSIQQCTTGHTELHTHNAFNTTMYYWSQWTIHTQCIQYNNVLLVTELHTQYIQYNNVLLVTELYTHNTTTYYWSLNYTHTMHIEIFFVYFFNCQRTKANTAGTTDNSNFKYFFLLYHIYTHRRMVWKMSQIHTPLTRKCYEQYKLSFLSHLAEFLGNACPVVSVTLGEHLHTPLLDEGLGIAHVAGNVAGQPLSLLLGQDIAIENAHLGWRNWVNTRDIHHTNDHDMLDSVAALP